jgi:tetratricopeptide (TPR) repeat protein
MNQNRLLELSDRLRKMKSDGDIDCSEVLRVELQASSSQEEKLCIYNLLGLELQSQGKLDEAEAVIRERIALEPEMPDGWITLALHLLYYTREAEKALSAINVALEKSQLQGSFFRQAHLERIRIALALESYPTIEESLTHLVNYVPARGSLDVQLEAEFLGRIPKGTINESLIQRYKEKVDAELDRSY